MEEVIAMCGNLPLALAWIGCVVKEECNPFESAVDLLKSTSCMEFAAEELVDPNHRMLTKCFEVSVAYLKKAQGPKICLRYEQLAIFPEDASINANVCALLWRVTPVEARLTLRTLCNHSLVTSSQEHFLLHDIPRKILQLSLPPGALQSFHKQLLDSYAESCLQRNPLDLTTGQLDKPGYLLHNMWYHYKMAGIAPPHFLPAPAPSFDDPAWLVAATKWNTAAFDKEIFIHLWLWDFFARLFIHQCY